ncbi:phage tail sheath family protein [Hymenobacter norwichensis]|uniref:phage tail sheath family protein n=1 Tax=Hymenobacter norwichensis TaxID=223903 RepID=UPI0003B69DF3|nr:phage tail sheath C-terminal domain-containing protein [Hymenobacter norwichensis]
MPGPSKTPGVYVEEIPKFPPSVAAVPTAIPAFVGYTQQAQRTTANDLHLQPTRITSMAEYRQYFGGPQPETAVAVTITGTLKAAGKSATNVVATLAETARSRHILYYAMQLFFANGGGPCYIASVGLYKPLGTALVLAELTAGLAVLRAADELTLLVLPEAQALASIIDFKALQDLALAQCALRQDRFVLLDVHGDGVSLNEPGPDFLTVINNFRRSGISSGNLRYGAAYAPNLATVLDYAVDEGAVVVHSFQGFKRATITTLSSLATTNPQRYELAKAAIRDLPCKLPPSAAVAGVYATVDASRGVWKAPANVSLVAVLKPTFALTNAQQDQLNVDPVAGKSVNAIREFVGKGTLVWGARTLAGNDSEWRYVNVQRLFLFVEESVKKAIQPFGFEPNDATTWGRVQSMVENFLLTLWRQGALPGIKPEHAFYVAVGLGRTMTALDILEGRMVVEMGLAATRPAEFIVRRLVCRMASA